MFFFFLFFCVFFHPKVMSSTYGEEDILIFGEDLFGIDVGVGVTLSCLHNIL